ncbi:sodium:proton antiporter NhaD [Cesiribacter andamanensis]|uniref:Na+/H+ antiporter, NhaD family n=1 Tax=Cesiribacter andamanensis AMV16 TaxID=1279009 RepID=M7NGN4_9BACT|nr:sodium:proton antiporter NhaD [Cesiribacter andamanensis]EMR00995.1 Na+/H+ antiporter, NhaD family [Cesiribacter andamanensis AMV16]
MIWIVAIFVIGYLFITLEHTFHINKAASALLAGVLCWTIYATQLGDVHLVNEQLMHHLSEISGILFFLLGAMTIVEIIDLHDGFEVIISRIRTRCSKKLLWILGGLAFVLSAILDNLTTTIVLVSLLRKLVPQRDQRLFYAGMVIIAANAGGAFTPIGDVTTTMLWIGGQITTENIVQTLFFPSLACFIFPMLYLTFKRSSSSNSLQALDVAPVEHSKLDSTPFERKLVLGLGVAALVFVPIFKYLTHLPPYMGILLGLGILWVVIELVHHKKAEEEKTKFSVLTALKKVDSATVLFFLGILLSIGALQSAGQLAIMANVLDAQIGNFYAINFLVGLLSAVVDNVPLVAAMMRMYHVEYPTDHAFWEFLAYCAGTGGSVLIIGSAAGVAAMGLEKINFMWYLRKMSGLALIGYIAGALVFLLQQQVVSNKATIMQIFVIN